MSLCQCHTLPDDLVGVQLASVAALLGHTELVEVCDRASFHRCRHCGALWEEQSTPFMHADVDVVARTDLGADGKPRHVAFNLARSNERVPG